MSSMVKMRLIISVVFLVALCVANARTFSEDKFLEDTSSGFSCKGKKNGLYQDPDDCAGFIQCANGRTFHMKCGTGTKYNAKRKICDWPNNVTCPEFCSSRPDGIYADPETCKGFIHCHNNRTAHKDCPAGLLFNRKLKICDWPKNVDCPIDPDGSGDFLL